MSAATAQTIWLVCLAGVVVLWARAVARSRTASPVPRGEALATFALFVALLGGAAAAWGGLVAEEGLARVETELAAPSTSGPARARLFLRHVQLFWGTGMRATVGYSPTAALQLPRDYGLDEAAASQDVFTLEDAGPRTARVEINVTPTSTTRVVTQVLPGSGDEPGAARRALLDEGRCRRAAAAPATLDGGPQTTWVLLCTGDEPRALLAFERELGRRDAAAIDTPLRVTPWVWRGGAFRPHHVHLEPGTLLQVGASTDALPGVTLWQIPAPAGRPGLLFPPKNLLAPCAAWLEGNTAEGGGGGFFAPSLGMLETPAPPEMQGASFACVLPFTPPFALEVRRLLPDTSGVWLRSGWAAALLGGPAAILLAAFALARGSARTRSAFARVLGVCFTAGVLVAVLVIRLLLAHRLDMMRDYEPVGARVAANEVFVALVAAVLAGVAVAVGLGPARRPALRALLAAAAWLVTLALGLGAIAPDAPVGPALVLQAVASLALATAPAWWRLVAARHTDLRALLVGLGAVGVVAIAGHALAARSVPAKLATAWTFVPLAYLALRASLGRPARVVALTGAVIAVVLGCIVRLDTGVAVAISGGGLVLVLVAAAHDALFTDADSGILDAWGRQSRPFVTGETALLLVGSGLVAVWACAGLAGAGPEDPALPASVTGAALAILLLAAALFAGAAVALRERAPRRAVVWLVLGLVLAAAWVGRGVAIDKVLSGKSEASSRVAAILDPAYALLADERAFAKGLTAWRETAAPPGTSLAGGQGYFGAQLLDPGVLLSIDNDYLPVLLGRELGAGGLVRLAGLFLGSAFALWWVGAGRFHGGSAPARVRRIVAALVGIVTLYQLVGSLGVLPFTGIAWPGLGIDSPSDLWMFVALLVFLALLGDAPAEPDRARVPASSRRLLLAAAAAVTLAGCLVAARAGAFALRRREPVEPTANAARLLAPFQGLEAVFDYVYRMQCPSPAPTDIVRPLLGDADTPTLRRFQSSFLAAWGAEEAAARAELARFRAGADKAACTGGSGHWRYERKGGACRMTFKDGWPAVAFGFSEGKSTCDVTVGDEVLRAFRYPLRRPYADARIRLTARATGAAARDRGELVSGQVVVRLRPGAGVVDVSSARAGVYAAEKVTIGEGVEVGLDKDQPTVRRPPRGGGKARLLALQAPRVHQLEGSARWDTHLLDAGGAPTPLDALAVVVVGGSTGRNVWLFRPASLHPGDLAATIDPLLADDVVSVLGSRRRQYVYGGLLPELGWVSPALADKSLGLDGWIHAAAARVEPGKPPPVGPADMCGTLAPTTPDPASAFARVCAPSPVDQVLECRVSLQPELETRLRHLLELTAEKPELFAPAKKAAAFRPATAASFALVRGDSGEIVAQGGFVPGRESTAYAPATPSLEKYLVAARDDRDPVTGAPAPHEESGAEKADWPAAIAIGSTMKPLFARALERAAPDAARALVLTAAGKRSGCEAILGHCPPTKTLWNHTESAVDLGFFLAASVNWYQAAIGLLGTALPDGELGFGDGPAVTPAYPMAVEKQDDTHRLWTKFRGRDVIRADGTIDPTSLRTTPFWRELEALLGRPLCTGAKDACTRAADRRDLCAARALPLVSPSADLRHLVATGPNAFDFSDGGPPRERQLVKEYLQFLRGSGKHPLASTLQLADAFNRLFYDGGPSPYHLAASWFPIASVGKLPKPCTRAAAEGRTVEAGLCRAIVDGTAGQLASRLGDDKIILYGAKTGTVDSLGDIVERRAACEAWNRAHTLAGAPAQPYHLDCSDAGRNELNDSLFVIGFGVKQADGTVLPFTLAVRYQRAGSVPPYGYAVYAVSEFLDLIADYFG